MCVLTSVIKLVYSFEDFKVFPKDFVSSTLKSANKDKHPSNVRLSIEFYLLVIKGWKIKIWLRLIKSVKKRKDHIFKLFPVFTRKVIDIIFFRKRWQTDHWSFKWGMFFTFTFYFEMAHHQNWKKNIIILELEVRETPRKGAQWAPYSSCWSEKHP